MKTKMVTKVVTYNGGTEYYGGNFLNPTVLQKGRQYELEQSIKFDWHTEYYLKGIGGPFNSVWFTEEEQELSSYKPKVIRSYNRPEEGLPLVGYPVLPNGNTADHIVCTSNVQDMDVLYEGLYTIKTRNSVFIVELISRC